MDSTRLTPQERFRLAGCLAAAALLLLISIYAAIKL